MPERESKIYPQGKNLQKIRDHKLRGMFCDAFERGGKEAVLDLAKNQNIKRLRCLSQATVIPIQDNEGRAYKGYIGGSNWGIEIFEYPSGCKKAGKWEGITVTRFEANAAFNGRGNWQRRWCDAVNKRRPHPGSQVE